MIINTTIKSIGLGMSLAVSAGATEPQMHAPNARATKIAVDAKTPQKALDRLLRRVNAMRPSSDGFITKKLLEDTRSLLGAKGSPAFVFQVGRAGQPTELRNALLKALPREGVAPQPLPEPLFPAADPVPILAAAGTSWIGHHTYPGGLVFHLETTAVTNLKLLETYEQTYDFHFRQSEKDLVVLAAIWHDAAKTWTLQWQPDGSLTSNEGKIANAGSHHVLSTAEALIRGHAREFVMAIAASHDAPNESLKDSHKKVVHTLVAAATLAGKSLEQVGVVNTDAGYDLMHAPSLWMMVQNLGDGDWVLTGQALQTVHPKLKTIVDSLGLPDPFWKVDALLSRHGEILPYQVWSRDGDAGLKTWVRTQLNDRAAHESNGLDSPK